MIPTAAALVILGIAQIAGPSRLTDTPGTPPPPAWGAGTPSSDRPTPSEARPVSKIPISDLEKNSGQISAGLIWAACDLKDIAPGQCVAVATDGTCSDVPCGRDAPPCSPGYELVWKSGGVPGWLCARDFVVPR